MENVRRVTDHLQTKAEEPLHTLSLVPTLDGDASMIDQRGDHWRMYRYLEGMRSYDSAPSKAHVSEAAREFGRFLGLLRDLPGPRLNETIPDFHHTPARFARLHDVCAADPHNRKRDCLREIDQALAHEETAGLLIQLHERGDIPERIVHNDTKLNNVMFDSATGKAVCVIDLDTVMPGLAPYDFGDMVRSATMTAAEDETDLSLVAMRLDYYEALARGFVSATGDFLTEAEAESLPVSGKIITIEAGIRFLTDYLSGDEYFRTRRPGQNLDRCRAHFALVASINDQLDDMQKLTRNTLTRRR